MFTRRAPFGDSWPTVRHCSGYLAHGTTNVYEVAYSYGNCTGNYAVLNGVQFTGLATLTTGSASGQLVMAVTGASSTTEYGIVSTLMGG